MHRVALKNHTKLRFGPLDWLARLFIQSVFFFLTWILKRMGILIKIYVYIKLLWVKRINFDINYSRVILKFKFSKKFFFYFFTNNVKALENIRLAMLGEKNQSNSEKWKSLFFYYKNGINKKEIINNLINIIYRYIYKNNLLFYRIYNIHK